MGTARKVAKETIAAAIKKTIILKNTLDLPRESQSSRLLRTAAVEEPNPSMLAVTKVEFKLKGLLFMVLKG